MEAEGKGEGGQVTLSQREAGDVGLGVAGPWAAQEGWGWGSRDALATSITVPRAPSSVPGAGRCSQDSHRLNK